MLFSLQRGREVQGEATQTEQMSFWPLIKEHDEWHMDSQQWLLPFLEWHIISGVC